MLLWPCETALDVFVFQWSNRIYILNLFTDNKFRIPLVLSVLNLGRLIGALVEEVVWPHNVYLCDVRKGLYAKA